MKRLGYTLSKSLAAAGNERCDSLQPLRPKGRRVSRFELAALLLLASAYALVQGCGSAPSSITGISASALALDAAQSVAVTATVAGSHPLRWTLSGTGCTDAGCGSLSATTGSAVTYTAPATVATAFTANLTAQVEGTSSLRTVVISVHPAPAITAALPGGTVGVAYSTTVGVTGGVAPYKLSIAQGTLPAGLTLNAASGSIAGTPTAAGVFHFSLQIGDASDAPQATVLAQTIVIEPPPPPPIAVGSSTLPNGRTNLAYSASIALTGGTAPYRCTAVSGALPAGLALGADCTIAGVPTAAGSFALSISAMDSATPAQSAGASIHIAIQQTPALTVTAGILPQATVGAGYSASVKASGGNAPYLCTVSAGTVPAGLTLRPDCSITGSPTATGASSFTATVADSSTPAQTSATPVAIVVNAAPTLQIAAPPAAVAGAAYAGSLGVSGGAAPYHCSLMAGALPAGLSLQPNCQIAGTAAAAGSARVTVQATDSGSPALTGSAAVVLTVAAPASALSVAAPAPATVGAPYIGSLNVTGGSAPYTCVVSSGQLPAGVALSHACALSGIPSASGSSAAQITVQDTSTPVKTTTASVSFTVQSQQPLTLSGLLPAVTLNQAYSQALQASGGVGPYTYALTAGALPAGLSLSASGVLSGTVAAVGAAGFTVTVTDSAATPHTVAQPMVLQTVFAATPQDALLHGEYAFLFQGFDEVASGALAYQTATAGSFSADGAGVVAGGEQDSNHHMGGATGNAETLLGTYTIDANYRGRLVLTIVHADGSTGETVQYSIALQTPAANAVTTAGSLMRLDADGSVGTKGTGTIAAQTPSAFLNRLNGSYAFGMWGDTPCLPTCSGLEAGPVATVGQLVANAGSVTGMSDTAIASAATASSALSGSYGFSDGHGRVSLTIRSAKLGGTLFPTNFVAYVIDSSHVLLLSTDSHASAILQAGTAELQTQAVFSNASLNGGYVGYESSPASPDLLGTTLQHVLGVGTATIFRGSGDGSGSCDTTAADTSGSATVIRSLQGVVDAAVVNALQGAYIAHGSSTCSVESNGRTTLAYPSQSVVQELNLAALGLPIKPSARVAYLSGPNQGYFLESGYAALGMLLPQSGAPFSNASLHGRLVRAAVPAGTLTAADSVGTLLADGAGNATWTTDENGSVGNANLLNLDLTGTATYNATDVVAGRYQLSTNEVIYAVTPERYVVLEPESAQNSASISVLY